MILKLGQLADLANGKVAKYLYENWRPEIRDTLYQLEEEGREDSLEYRYLALVHDRIVEKVERRTEKVLDLE